ncbi:hypothetical protein [Ktedonobacter robiniae]|uniref:hypothetical protein n=1 Tax=Ktedonobacter robiniae TaxID=2778365 RepID=UPI00191609B2|nr:hypothetical protein [Ktedonobacter robiniae]
MILTLSDGLAWADHSLALPSISPRQLDAVTWSGSQFVAVGFKGTLITSPDGKTWTARIIGTVSALINVVWSGSRFVAVGDNGTILASP